MQVVYAREPMPNSFSRSIFLAGPTPRDENTQSWRPHALKILKRLKYDGVVFVPEPSGFTWNVEFDYHEQVEWEEAAIHRSDCIVFWLPRDMTKLPGITTNDEWGTWKHKVKCVLGYPKDAVKVGYQKKYADDRKIAVTNKLEDTLQSALEFIGRGEYRVGGECDVPLMIWRRPEFKEWHRAQVSQGNIVRQARLSWIFSSKPGHVFFWAMHVSVYIAAENRQKDNEVIVGRPDIAVAVMYYPKKTPELTEIVLVKEFRSPVRNPDGYVWELPGGSSKIFASSHDVILAEIEEETSLKLSRSRLRYHDTRQLNSTSTIHHAKIFSVKLTQAEFAFLKERQGQIFGVSDDTERTELHIISLRDINRMHHVDLVNLGIIHMVLCH
ncbi:hypothetical protein COT97_05880 [Candidatus Falkowbacteria bacterium CG10_big_fil_rev_8_21_14_0_10_39_11]|uniref:Nudix hydrolase domain-containing protein n=1 Tax=Candidatus Falkowbacteria bacterium CG10_big_fil_rev_8_21_14_0_10_39_11 TaxID=1974565 RepID=A0A2H0V3G3_9BACT|nr:MAG: hypothetical protein COT97_05880 [Candidatus Falkowbacteria bacterium CG10_big_fil_rev_8_21_14_0_10_39_11]